MIGYDAVYGVCSEIHLISGWYVNSSPKTKELDKQDE